MKKEYHLKYFTAKKALLKLTICFFLLSFPSIYSQDKIDDRVNELKDKISQVEDAEKLKLLDSLCVIIKHKPEYKYRYGACIYNILI